MNRGRVADLYNTFTGDTCLTLWYNINGAKSIEVVVDKGRVVKVLKSTDTKWHMAQVEITGVKKRVRVINLTIRLQAGGFSSEFDRNRERAV